MTKPHHLWIIVLLVVLIHLACLFSLFNIHSLKTERLIQPSTIMGVMVTPVVKPIVVPEQATPIVRPAPKKIVEKKPVKNLLATKTSPTPTQDAIAPVVPVLSPSEVKPEAKQVVHSEALVLPHTDAHYINNPAPDYPPMSRRAREEGMVTLIIKILANGQVSDVRVKETSGYKRLDQAAIKTVKRWQFVPAKKGEVPIDYDYELPVEFSLN